MKKKRKCVPEKNYELSLISNNIDVIYSYLRKVVITRFAIKYMILLLLSLLRTHLVQINTHMRRKKYEEKKNTLTNTNYLQQTQFTSYSD